MKIIRIEDRNKLSENPNLDELLKFAVDIKGDLERLKKSYCCRDPHRLFLAKLMDFLISEKMISSSEILCGIYVAKLLASLLNESPESWFAFDYTYGGHTFESPFLIQAGADICFLISSIFPERGNIRAMKTKDYSSFGASLFMQYYQMTAREIGYHMACNFEPMATAVKRCIGSL